MVIEEGHEHEHEAPTVSTPGEAAELFAELFANGSDCIKIMIEEGSMLGAPGLPVLSDETITTAVREAHCHDKMAIAHALTAAQQAIAAGMDGLAHVFIDRPSTTPELVTDIAASGAFVTSCLCLNFSIMGNRGADLAANERVRSRLSEE